MEAEFPGSGASFFTNLNWSPFPSSAQIHWSLFWPFVCAHLTKAPPLSVGLPVTEFRSGFQLREVSATPNSCRAEWLRSRWALHCSVDQQVERRVFRHIFNSVFVLLIHCSSSRFCQQNVLVMVILFLADSNLQLMCVLNYPQTHDCPSHLTLLYVSWAPPQLWNQFLLIYSRDSPNNYKEIPSILCGITFRGWCTVDPVPGTHSTLGAEKLNFFVCFEVIKRSNIVYKIGSAQDYVNLYPNEFI